MSDNIGDYSIVNEYVIIGNGSRIWHHCNIYGTAEEPVVIGNNTQVGSFTEIKPDVKIGNNVRMQSYVFIPEGITIDDFVFVAPGVTFTNDKHPSAIKTIKRTWELRRTYVGQHVTLGARAVINPGINVGEYSFVGSGSVLTRDVEPYSVVVGTDRVIGDMRDEKFLRYFPEFRNIFEAQKELPQ